MSPQRSAAKHGAGLAVLLAVCAVVYWLGLGSGGFHATEAHRAVPAYEMLDHAGSASDWLVPRMFEQPYLRKPPGMPWAIAGMSSVLGETVFAARAVSALASTLMALIAFFIAGRWFGARAALPAGLAQALMPVLWESGRAAEIEPLNHLGTQIAALLLIDALVFASAARARVLAALGAAAGILWFALAKGPASAPVVIAVIAAVCITARSLRPLAGVVWLSIGAAGVAVGGVAWMIARAAAAEPVPPITQSPSAFMFEPGMILGVLTLPFVAFAQTLPASLALLFPWGPDANSEAGNEGWSPASHRLARTLAVAWLVAIGLFMVFGVRNPRYTLPASVLLAPLAGAYIAGSAPVLGGWLTARRARIARSLLLGRGAALVGVLLIGSVVYQRTVEANRRATSATATGVVIAEAIAEDARLDGAVLYANDVIEARPELVLALERRLRELGREISVIWSPELGNHLTQASPDRPVLVLLRIDADSPESGFPGARELGGRLTPMPGHLEGWVFHKYRAALYLVDGWD